MNAAARLTIAEAAIARLSVSRGPRVSTALRAARQRSLTGEPPPVQVYDVGELEALARGTGLRATVAKARLRLARRGPSTRPGAHRTPAMGLALAGDSANSALPNRIDQLLAVHTRA